VELEPDADVKLDLPAPMIPLFLNVHHGGEMPWQHPPLNSISTN
jgi:hypothetical protein